MADESDQSGLSEPKERVSWSEECVLQFKDAGPLLTTNVAINLLSTASLALVGHLGPAELAAVCMAQVIMTGSLVILLGNMNALGHLSAEARDDALYHHEQGNVLESEKAYKEVGAWLQMGLVLPLVLFFPMIAGVWSSVGTALAAMGACEGEVCDLAESFATMSLGWVVPFTIFQCISVYLDTIGIMWPQALISIIFCAIGVVLNYIFIFGLRFAHIPWPGMGVIGAPAAAAVTQWVQLSVLCLFVWGRTAYEPAVVNTWHGWSESSFSVERATHFLALGAPMCMWDLIDYWVPGLLVLMAGIIGSAQVQAAGVILSVIVLCQPLVLTFKYSMFARIDAHFDAETPHKARDTYSVGLSCSLMLSLILGLFLWKEISWVTSLFNCTHQVTTIATDMLPAAIAYFVLFCFNSYNYELQNAKEDTWTANIVAVLSRWVVGVGMMLVVVFKGWGAHALWPCLFVAEFCHAIFLLVLVCQTDWDTCNLMSPIKAANTKRGILASPVSNYGTMVAMDTPADSLSPSL